MVGYPCSKLLVNLYIVVFTCGKLNCWMFSSVEVGIRLSGKVHGIFLFCPRYRD